MAKPESMKTHLLVQRHFDGHSSEVAFNEPPKDVAEAPDPHPLVVLADEITVPALIVTLHVPQQTRVEMSSF
jgi:hypothetical protein